MGIKLGILGDVHCQDVKLVLAINYLRNNADAIVCVGDIVDGTGDCSKCIDLLIENEILAVRGNHDAWLLANEMRSLNGAIRKEELSEKHIIYLSDLKAEVELSFARIKLLLCHGIGTNDMACIKPDDYGYGLECNEDLWKVIRKNRYQYMIGGHTHKEMVRKIEKLVIINPGSMDNATGSNFGIFDFEDNEMRCFNVLNNEITEIGKMGIMKS
jgi:putative phosphoesterase